MTKFDYEIENFINHFSKYKAKKIALYGTGRMTATLISGVNNFNFAGLCDRDECLTGTQVYGLPVLSREQAENLADLIIINTSETYWNTIYQRIKNWKLPIYFLNGQRASEYKEASYEWNSYWNQSYQELKETALKYDVISFDIFDTLIMRKVMFPIDVFHLTESKLGLILDDDIDYIAVRKKASSLLIEPTLDEIYVKITELTGRSILEVNEWKAVEILTERQLLTARKDMIMLCKELMAVKQVFFISDMYYTSDILRNFLREAGLEVEKQQIIVSCERKKTKESGELWKYFKTEILRNKTCLHIGDNYKSDFVTARDNGIDAYQIMSAFDMLQNSSMNRIVPYIESLYGSISMALIVGLVFNSPFALNQTKGNITFANEVEAGFCLLGCLMDTFCRWMIQKARKDQIKQLVFFSREGYLLIPLYEHMKKILYVQDAPITTYLEISRRAIWGATIKDVNDVYEVARFPYNGNLLNFLKDRFGIVINNDKLAEIDMYQIQANDVLLKKALQPYETLIIQNSKKEQENYNEYVKGLHLNTEMATVDSQFFGSTQYYLGKFLNKSLKGYYFCVFLEETNRYMKTNQMFGCFQGIDASNTNVHKQAQFLESYFTSPNGMLEYINENGEMKYTSKMLNQLNFDVRYEMNKGIMNFMNEMTDVLKEHNLDQSSMDYEWADLLFGCFMNNGFIATLKMKKSFYFDNKVLNNREMPIWE